ncbi:MAG: glycosyltransferase family 39 protein [Candidatus Omnitrophica bacterium]|nr:glycosyltransferase family 39 protein [Candidatus Omnitrophota bacterium]
MKFHIRNIKASYIIPLILFIVSFFLRISLISKGPYHSDCLYLALQSQEILTTHQIHYLHGLGFPLTALMGACFIWLSRLFSVNDPVLAVNFMNVLFGSLSVVVLYLCVEQIFDKKTALFSGVILSLNPLFLALSTFGNSHILSVFFFLASLYSLLNYLKNPSRHKLILSGICLGLFGATRLQDLMAMAIPFCFLLWFPPHQLRRSEGPANRSWTILPELSILSVLCCITTCLFYFPSWIKGASSIVSYSIFDSVTRHFLDYLTHPSLSLILERFFTFFASFSPLEWLAIIAGLIYLLKSDTKLFSFLAIWIFTFFIFFGNLIFSINRHFTLVLIPVIIAESYFLSHLPKKKFLPRRIVTFTFTFVLVLNLLRFYPTIYFRHKHALLPDFFTWVSRKTEPNAYIIERDHSLFIHYYAKRTPLAPKIKLYTQGHDILKEFKGKIDALLNQEIPVYITKYGILYRPKHKFRKFMIQHYAFDYVGTKTVEDWHKGCLKQVLVNNDLLRIRKLEPLP